MNTSYENKINSKFMVFERLLERDFNPRAMLIYSI